MRGIFSAALLVSAAIFWYCCHTNDALPARVSYNFHIRPILSDKCFSCHGPDKNKRKASLRLDLEDHAKAPLTETPGAFAIVPGKPDASELYKRIISDDPDYLMPSPESHLGKLTEKETALIYKWIRQGAKYEKHWAFIPPQKNDLPRNRNRRWARNEIDYFVWDKMREKGLSPNDPATPEMLLKRASLDITGLPPSLEHMDAYLHDQRENAYEKWLDTLLALPQYGERMALLWMDIARYADSYGYQDDNIRTQWPWRDWVIHAFNQNLPYDRFITWQLAGDLLPDKGKEQILATGFLRNHKYTEEGGVIPEEYRIEYTIDKTKTYSKGLLGLTVECAQCHDHKYDPVTQQDYYQLFAFFNNSREVGFEGDVNQSKPAKNPVLKLPASEIKNILQFIRYDGKDTLMVSVMEELKSPSDTPRITRILRRGVYDQPGDTVRPNALQAILPFDTTTFSTDRLGLAQWTTDRRNPLTARVFVNLIWQELFGTGIVKTAGDFGMQGSLPSHPELLDWLAVDFMEHGWDIKRLMKKIMLSATYRQSAEITATHLERDPDNTYLARAPRLRVKAETVRDLVLASSGLLNPAVGGASVKPYQPKGLWERATSGRGQLAIYEPSEGSDLYRRGLYTFIKLTVPPPSMILFDASNRDQCEVKRTLTNTPLQALIMLNDPTVLEASRYFAQQLMEKEPSTEARISRAFRTIICRSPGEKELDILTSYYREQESAFKSGMLDASRTLTVGASPPDRTLDPNASAALMKVISTIYNMEEAITKT